LSRDSAVALELPELAVAEAREAFAAATVRIVAYWNDECARDLAKLMTHFTGDAEVVTPDGVFRGHAAVAELYQKSFDAYPGLTVDVKAAFPGRDGDCFEYGAVLFDAEDNRWLVEGINLMRLKGGLISYLRSFEDAPRRLATGGESR
jgi:hypothetical protein